MEIHPVTAAVSAADNGAGHDGIHECAGGWPFRFPGKVCTIFNRLSAAAQNIGGSFSGGRLHLNRKCGAVQ
jgi:hypothetical protein